MSVGEEGSLYSLLFEVENTMIVLSSSLRISTIWSTVGEPEIAEEVTTVYPLRAASRPASSKTQLVASVAHTGGRMEASDCLFSPMNPGDTREMGVIMAPLRGVIGTVYTSRKVMESEE